MRNHLNPIMLLILMSSCANALPSEDVPDPAGNINELDPEGDRHRFVFKTYDAEESWDMAFSRAWEMMGNERCISAFEIAAEVAPRDYAASGEYVLMLAKEWSHPQYAGYTTCDPPWVSLDYRMAVDFGPTATGATIIHELLHAATCDEWWGRPGALEAGEKLAYTVQGICENSDPDDQPNQED